jgi:hypothetical protein
MLSVNCSTRRSVAWLKTPDHAFFATETPRVATALDPLKRNNTFSVNGLRQWVNDRPSKAADPREAIIGRRHDFLRVVPIVVGASSNSGVRTNESQLADVQHFQAAAICDRAAITAAAGCENAIIA